MSDKLKVIAQINHNDYIHSRIYHILNLTNVLRDNLENDPRLKIVDDIFSSIIILSKILNERADNRTPEEWAALAKKAGLKKAESVLDNNVEIHEVLEAYFLEKERCSRQYRYGINQDE